MEDLRFNPHRKAPRQKVVYAIQDMGNGDIVYVGQAFDPWSRTDYTRKDYTRKIEAWLATHSWRKLELERVEPVDADEAERLWIVALHAIGSPLLNVRHCPGARRDKLQGAEYVAWRQKRDHDKLALEASPHGQPQAP